MSLLANQDEVGTKVEPGKSAEDLLIQNLLKLLGFLPDPDESFTICFSQILNCYHGDTEQILAVSNAIISLWQNR